MIPALPTRKAILISCPGTGDDFLPGSVKDPRNVTNFLCSPKGGSWKRAEIVTLNNPTWETVWLELVKDAATYTVVYFSGHGYTDIYANRMLCLRDTDVADVWLLNGSSKQLVIVDACREYVRPGISGIPEAVEPYAYADGYAPAREAFDEFIKRSPAGKMIIHATEAGLIAKDDRFGDGGAFTLALLSTAIATRTNKEYSPITLRSLLPKTTEKLVTNGYLQYPCIVYETGNLTIPLAIDAPQVLMLRKQGEEIKPKSNPNVRKAIAGLSVLTIIGLFLGGLDE